MKINLKFKLWEASEDNFPIIGTFITIKQEEADLLHMLSDKNNECRDDGYFHLDGDINEN